MEAAMHKTTTPI